MIALETNILVHARREESPFHHKSKAVLEGLRFGEFFWAVPWPCVCEFIGKVTHPKIFNPPTTLQEAFAAVEAWDSTGNLYFLSEGGKFFEALQDVAMMGAVKGSKIHDARIAALCISHGITELWTADRDFSSFPKLKTRNPLL